MQRQWKFLHVKLKIVKPLGQKSQHSSCEVRDADIQAARGTKTVQTEPLKIKFIQIKI